MKKRLISMSLALLICFVGLCNNSVDVRAEEPTSQDVPLSVIMTEDALLGHSTNNTWGIYYLDGYSIINDAGGGKIGWGGITNAARTCKVSVTSIVERYSNGSWVRVTSATTTVESGLMAVVSKSTLVGSGYYYRVRSSHYASTDVSSSCTSSLLM